MAINYHKRYRGWRLRKENADLKAKEIREREGVGAYVEPCPDGKGFNVYEVRSW